MSILAAPTPESDSHTSYNPEFFSKLFAAEDRHFWFRARNHILSSVVSRLTAELPDGFRVLEIGCGTGNTLQMLERVCQRGLVVGMDLHAEGLRFARQRVRCPLVQGDIHQPPLAPGFDLICLFDVIEHLPDDVGVLQAVRPLLAARGRLLVTVPAHMSLWSYFDEAAHHCRRYAVQELQQRLTESGYRVEYLSQYLAALYPLMWLKRRLSGGGEALNPAQAAERASAELKIVPVVNEVLAWTLSCEAPLVRSGRRLPLGTSLLAIARVS